jgi:hypothetical protein
VTVTLTSDSGSVFTCNPVGSYLSDSTQWPPVAHMDNAPGHYTTVRAAYTLHSAIAVFWAGGQTTNIGSITLPAQSKIAMQF